MRDPARIGRIAHLIYKIWNKKTNQDLRLMQLLLNSIPEPFDDKLYPMEDEKLEQLLLEFYNEK